MFVHSPRRSSRLLLVLRACRPPARWLGLGRLGMGRLATGLLGMCLLGMGLLGTAKFAAADDKQWDSEKDNVLVRVPRDVGEWDWLPPRAEWAKVGIVKGARRELKKLKNGKPPDGQGGILHVFVRQVREEDTLEGLAHDDDIRKLLLGRFGGSAPEVEEEKTTVGSGTDPENGYPAIVLRAEGEANNLKGKKGACNGVLLLSLYDKRLYMLRMYAFPTEFDQEGVGFDLDYLEGNCLELINTKPPKAKEGPRPKDPAGAPGKADPDKKEEEREDEVLEFRDQHWQVTIDKKLKRLELTEDDDADHLVLKIEDSDQHGSVVLYLYAIPNVQYKDGVKMAAPDLVKWMTSTWWLNFHNNHPKGDLFTFKWPRKPEGKNPTFLTLPDLDDPENKVGLITGDEKRPIEISKSDATKKLKFVDKPPKNKIGKRGKGGEALRGALMGNRPQRGWETVVRYCWRTATHSYRLFVLFGGEGYKKWGAPVRKTLESWEFGVKFKK